MTKRTAAEKAENHPRPALIVPYIHNFPEPFSRSRHEPPWPWRHACMMIWLIFYVMNKQKRTEFVGGAVTEPSEVGAPAKLPDGCMMALHGDDDQNLLSWSSSSFATSFFHT